MNFTTLEVYSSKLDLSASLSLLLARHSVESVSSHGYFTVALSGGSIPSLLTSESLHRSFELLGERPNFDRWHVFMADERVVASDSDDSNLKAWRTVGFLSTELDTCKVYGLLDSDVLALSLSELSSKYSSSLSSVLGSLKQPGLDLALLGMGEDGHTCSIFPSPATPPVLADPSDKVGWVDNSPKAPPRRITITMETVNASRAAVFVAMGEGKNNVLRDIFKRVDVAPASSSHSQAESPPASVPEEPASKDLEHPMQSRMRQVEVACVGEQVGTYPCARVRPSGTGQTLVWLVDEMAAKGI